MHFKINLRALCAFQPLGSVVMHAMKESNLGWLEIDIAVIILCAPRF